MEAIAAKLLRKYLSVFFKNIKKENISLNMSEGKAELTKIGLIFFFCFFFSFFLNINFFKISRIK